MARLTTRSDGRNALAAVGFFVIFRTWLRLIILGTIVGALVSLGVALVTPPTYLSHVTLIVAPTTTNGAITFSDVEVTQALAPTFAELATTTPVLERVIADTKVDLDSATLARTIQTHVPVGTSLIDISVTHRDPATAAALANSIAAQLAQYQAHGAAQVSALRVSLAVVDPANTPQTPEGLSIPIRTALGGAIGLMLALSIGFFVENLGRGVRSVGRNLADGGGPDGSSGAASTMPSAPATFTPATGPGAPASPGAFARSAPEAAPMPASAPASVADPVSERLQRVLADDRRADPVRPAETGAFRIAPSTVLSQTVIRPALAASPAAPAGAYGSPALDRTSPTISSRVDGAASAGQPARPAAPAIPLLAPDMTESAAEPASEPAGDAPVQARPGNARRGPRSAASAEPSSRSGRAAKRGPGEASAGS